MTQQKHKPMFVTWRHLWASLYPLHMNIKADVDNLHDIWKRGAPSPRSRVLLPAGYDPRVQQPGNFEERLMLFTTLGKWVSDVTTRRGSPMTLNDAVEMLRKVGQLAS